MLKSCVQPPIISLFSSTGSSPLGLFVTGQDDALLEDSCVVLVDDASGVAPASSPAKLISPPSIQSTINNGVGYSLSHTVLQIQSPTIRSTFIQSRQDLGCTHPWLHVQVRNLGREWSFEVGVVDQQKRKGTLRFSTFQSAPRLHPPSGTNPPLLHLPLSFPRPSPQLLTAWSTIAVHIPPLLPYFSDRSLVKQDDESALNVTLGGAYASLSYVKIYATCRLRRIWSSEAGPNQALPWEFQLYS